jgi:plasmid stabilization system protein ParE
MPRLNLSVRARADVKRLYDFLAQYDVSVAQRGNDAIYAALLSLTKQPMNGAPVVGLASKSGVRKLVVDFGASGYLIFHRYRAAADTVDVFAILHQKENYTAQSVVG